VLIAAGSGITPVLSIAATVLRDPASAVTVFYGNRHTETVMFVDELADLKDRYPVRLELVHVLSREPREAELFTGRLDADRLGSLLDGLVDVDHVAHWWLCGPRDGDGHPRPAGRLRGARRAHPPRAVLRGRRASRAGEAHRGPGGRPGHRGALPRDTTVLEGVQRCRPYLPFACKGGVRHLPGQGHRG
jgi:ring-1,2-phenylacetyl-CoA epoxidase subunit PaaE